MNMLNFLIKILLRIVVICCLLYFGLWAAHFIFAYKDVVLSIGAKKGLEGKLVYLLSGTDIKIIELPSGKKKNLYSVPQERKGYAESIGDLSFSPDGERTIFHKMDYLGNGYKYKLYIMNSDGSGVKKLLDLGENIDMFSPSWSPDGQYIVFGQHNPYKQGGIYIFNVDDPYRTLRMITNIRPSEHRIAWSPDSKEIAFISDEFIKKIINKTWYSETFLAKIYLVNIDGTNLRQLTTGTNISWSPDGKKIAYNKEEGYYLIDVNERKEDLIIPYKKPPFSFTVGDTSGLAWSPDCKYIAFIKEIWPGIAGLGIYVISVDNPKKQIRVATEFTSVDDMFWLK